MNPYYYTVPPKIDITDMGEGDISDLAPMEQVQGYRIRMYIYPPVGDKYVWIEGAFHPDLAWDRGAMRMAFATMGDRVFEKIRLRQIK